MGASFPCPKCGGPMEVKDSRPAAYRKKPSIRRRRACKTCQWRTTTFEIVDRGEADDDMKLAAMVGAARRAKSALAALIENYDNLPAKLNEESGVTRGA